MDYVSMIADILHERIDAGKDIRSVNHFNETDFKGMSHEEYHLMVTELKYNGYLRGKYSRNFSLTDEAID